MPEEAKFYTARGDDGTTGLLGKGRVKKYHPRPAACGDVDEAQAALGVARAATADEAVADVLLTVQRDLYHLMSELAATPEAAGRFRRIDAERVAWLEAQTDSFGAQIRLPAEFTVSGDTAPGAALDLARTVVRRAERAVVRLADDGLIENAELLRYLNRLSSLLFVLARYADALSGSSAVKLAKGGTADLSTE